LRGDNPKSVLDHTWSYRHPGNRKNQEENTDRLFNQKTIVIEQLEAWLIKADEAETRQDRIMKLLELQIEQITMNNQKNAA
jgi:hypothetical protein